MTFAVAPEGSRRLLRLAFCMTEPERDCFVEVEVFIMSAPNPEFKNAVRVQTSLVAPLERRCLNYFVQHLPAWVKPDHLTMLGFAAMFFAGSSYVAARWWPPALLLVNVWLVVNWFGDSLDGTLARFRNQQRPRYGFYVDHIIDALGSLFLFSGWALS